MKQNLEVLKTALGDSAPEEVTLLDQSIPVAAKVAEENSLNASHLYKLLNAKNSETDGACEKQSARARSAWKSSWSP